MTAPLVLVDATAIPLDRGGVGRYVDNLVVRLPGRVLVAVRRGDPLAQLPGLDVVEIDGIDSTARRLLWEQIGLPRIARQSGAAVIFSPHYTMPLFTPVPVVVCFHDATFFSDPRVHSMIKRWFFRAWIRVSGRRARKIVVPSQATAEEIRRRAGVHRPMKVIPHGVDLERFHPPTAADIAGAAAAVGRSEWIAFLGTIEPRKNLPALIEGYAAMAERLGRDGVPVPPLALAGGAGWERELDDDIAAVPAPGEVRRLGYVAADLLPGLLGGAVLVAYPSLGEGFGLPVLEAMACGAPVLTTRRLALPEVGGDAVAYTEPDSASIGNALADLVLDAPRRARLAQAGHVRAARFTWEASAVAHRAAFDDVS